MVGYTVPYTDGPPKEIAVKERVRLVTKCDNCGRATSHMKSAAWDGTNYCERRSCREAYEEESGERFLTPSDICTMDIEKLREL